MPLERIRFSVPAPLQVPPIAHFLDVVFHVTRGHLALPLSQEAQERLPPYLKWKPQYQAQVPRNVLRFVISPAVFHDSPDPIELEGLGEEPIHVKTIVRDPAREARKVSAPDPKCPSNGLVDVSLDGDLDVGISFDAAKYLEELKHELRHNKELAKKKRKKKACQFFHRFDLHTNTNLWDYLGEKDLQEWLEAKHKPADIPVFKDAVDSTLKLLRDRISARVEKPGDTTFPPEADADLLDQVKTLSAQQLGFYSSHTNAQLRDAFEWFANGDLRFQLPKCGAIAFQPSSGFYFLFAEFALLACDNDLAKRSWTSRARFLLETQRIFQTTYANPTKPADKRNLEDYHAKHYCGAGASRADIKNWRSEFKDLDHADLAQKANDHAGEYLGGL